MWPWDRNWEDDLDSGLEPAVAGVIVTPDVERSRSGSTIVSADDFS